MSTYAVVRQAIIEKKQVTAVYDGFYREFCPHVIGTKNGKEQALVFQFGGETSKGPIQDPENSDNWRCFELRKLENAAPRPGKWHTFNNHTKGTTCVDQIDVEVDF